MVLPALHNRLGRPSGPKSGGRYARKGLFPVLADTSGEYLAGLGDRQLDVRISVMRHARGIRMASRVRPHNALGRARLRLVLPAHILIPHGAVARMAG
jgi:hypothetical protein